MDSVTSKFILGNTIYSLNTFQSGILIRIECGNITIQYRDGKEETALEKFFTTEADIIISRLQEQVQEYKDAFFRQKEISLKLNGGRVM